MVLLSQNSLSDFVRQVASGFRNVCDTRNISLELDLDEVSTPYDRRTVQSAIVAMIENAIAAMPDGGELEATLIDGNGQWELEIADSGRQPTADEPVDEPALQNQSTDSLPRVALFPANEHLRRLNNISIILQGTVQTWNCPLGGTAHVLVVPKQISQQSSDRRRAA